MAHGSSATAEDDGSLIFKVDRKVAVVENVFNAVGAMFIVIVMIYMCCEVLSRKFLGRPLPGVIDWVELAMGTFAFLGAAYCQRVGGHVRMELVMGRLRGRILWATEALAVAIALFYISVIAYKSFSEDFMWAVELGDSTMDIELPVWPSKLVVPIAMTLLAIRLSINLWGYLRMFMDPSKTPIGVPIIKTAADVAREEIEEAMGHDADDLVNPNQTAGNTADNQR